MKKKDSRRGVALEMAITFLLLIFALCSLMTTMALVSHARLTVKRNDFLQSTEIQQLGENFCKEVNQKRLAEIKEFSSQFVECQGQQTGTYYYCKITVPDANDRYGVYTLRIYTADNRLTPKLIVKVNATDSKCELITWSRYDYK